MTKLINITMTEMKEQIKLNNLRDREEQISKSLEHEKVNWLIGRSFEDKKRDYFTRAARCCRCEKRGPSMTTTLVLWDETLALC